MEHDSIGHKPSSIYFFFCGSHSASRRLVIVCQMGEETSVFPKFCGS